MTRIALIDGPLVAGRWGCCERVDPWGGAIDDSPAAHHATAVASAILSIAPDADLVSIPVFQRGLSARAADLARALEIAGATGAEIVHCSLGLARDDADVARATAALAGRVVVGSAPARGGPVWPAASETVISVQGDARCKAAEWSLLRLPGAEFGACPRHETQPEFAGASVAAAHLTGILALHRISSLTEAKRFLESGASYVGRERRAGAV